MSKSGGKELTKEFTIFLGGLNFKTNENALTTFFTQNDISGKLKMYLLCKEDGKSKGFGYIIFNNKSDYEKAISLNGSLLDGFPIRLEPASFKFTSKVHQIIEENDLNQSQSSQSEFSSSSENTPTKSKKSRKSHQKGKNYSYSSDYSYSYSYDSYSYSSSSDSEQSKRRRPKDRKQDYSYSYSSYSYSSSPYYSYSSSSSYSYSSSPYYSYSSSSSAE